MDKGKLRYLRSIPKSIVEILGVDIESMKTLIFEYDKATDSYHVYEEIDEEELAGN